jgi:hypothetical protein
MGFLEKEVVKEASLKEVKLSTRPPARAPQPARPPADQRTVRPHTRSRFQLNWSRRDPEATEATNVGPSHWLTPARGRCYRGAATCRATAAAVVWSKQSGDQDATLTHGELDARPGAGGHDQPAHR